ncbi:MAG: hypothetical protein JHC93_08735, partial [Parachlamydiales bacterium]|nr:hypothetical protein [Parachlamydiales bacterium]
MFAPGSPNLNSPSLDWLSDIQIDLINELNLSEFCFAPLEANNSLDTNWYDNKFDKPFVVKSNSIFFPEPLDVLTNNVVEKVLHINTPEVTPNTSERTLETINSSKKLKPNKATQFTEEYKKIFQDVLVELHLQKDSFSAFNYVLNRLYKIVTDPKGKYKLGNKFTKDELFYHIKFTMTKKFFFPHVFILWKNNPYTYSENDKIICDEGISSNSIKRPLEQISNPLYTINLNSYENRMSCDEAIKEASILIHSSPISFKNFAEVAFEIYTIVSDPKSKHHLLFSNLEFDSFYRSLVTKFKNANRLLDPLQNWALDPVAFIEQPTIQPQTVRKIQKVNHIQLTDSQKTILNTTLREIYSDTSIKCFDDLCSAVYKKMKNSKQYYHNEFSNKTLQQMISKYLI